MTRTSLLPLRPRPSPALLRAAVAAVVGQVRPGGHHHAARDLYPDDATAAIVLRAAVEPGQLTSPEWAGVLGSTAVADFIGGLGPASAASQLIALGLELRLGRSAAVRVPSIVNSTAAAAFVAESAPIPVVDGVIGAAELKPHKLASIVVFTSETARSTAIESIMRTSLAEAAGLGLDAALLGTAAATAEAPAGLRNGATSVTPAAGGGDEAMVLDLAALAEAVAPIGGTRLAFVAAPGEAVKITLRARAPLAFPVLASAALPAGTVMAVAVNALVAAVDPVPEFDPASGATLHMEDTTPEPISTAGTPNTVAAPVRSLFQTDSVGLRMLLGVAWALRAPAADAVAVVGPVTW